MRRIAAAAFAALLVCAAPPARGQSAVPLAAFEDETAHAPAIAIARAAADVQRADAAIDRRGRAARLQGNALVGAYREQVTDTLTREYGGFSGTVGLREPILGEAAANRDAVLRGGIAVAQREGDVEIARRTVLRAVRQAYVGYWNAARRAALADDFGASQDEVERALAARERAHLLLRADELDFGSEYAAAHRDATRSARDAMRARGQLAVALGREVAPFAATTPTFTGICPQPEAAYAAALAHDPALTALEAEAETERRLAAHPAAPVTSGLDVTQSVGVQNPETGPGRATTLGVDFSFPVGAGGSLADERRRDRAQADATALRIGQARAQLRADVDDAWAGIVQTDDDLRFADSRAAAASEAVREDEARYGRVPGDALERLVRARYDYYRAASDRLDAQAALLNAQTELLFLTGEGCRATAAAVSSPSAPAPGARVHVPPLTVYAWQAAPLLDAVDADAAWGRLADAGIARVLLGLDAAAIARAGTSEGTARMNAALAVAAQHGIEVDLLLGDPNWIHPADRGEMLAIVRRLHGIAFRGLELDLEPETLVARGERRADVLRELAETAGVTAQLSPWPLGLSLSYRTFEGDPCLGCLLRTTALREIALLTYVANPARTAQLVTPILRANPGLRFAVAESVEPQLAADESYARRGRAGFLAATAQLDAALRALPNYAGIRVQALRELEALAP